MAPGKKDGKKPMQQPDKDEETKKRVLEMLEEMPDTVPGSKKFKSATKKLEFSIAFTKHQSTGQCSFKNLLLMFAILAKDKDGDVTVILIEHCTGSHMWTLHSCQSPSAEP